MKNLILYGIGNARYQYRVLRYFYVYDENTDVAEIKRIAIFYNKNLQETCDAVAQYIFWYLFIK